MIQALLVEDDSDLAATILDYLQVEGIACDYADNGMGGLRMAQVGEYDVLLLDINLPALDGLQLCDRLRAAGSDTPVLMLTARQLVDDKLAGFSVGADDYLIKPFELRELTARIRALARRRSGQSHILRCADLEMDLKTRTVTRRGGELKIAPLGLRILEALLRASPDVVPRRKLISAVWGEEPPDSDSLKVHLFHLRKSVNIPDAEPLLHTVPGRGFALRRGPLA